MKTTTFLITSAFLLCMVSASVGETTGPLNFNFTQTGQKMTDIWTLVNTGNTSVSFNVILPKFDNTTMLIWTNISSGTIPANSFFPIKVNATEFKASSFNGIISAMFKGSGNINVEINKNIYVTNANQKDTTSTSTITTTIQQNNGGSHVIGSSGGIPQVSSTKSSSTSTSLSTSTAMTSQLPSSTSTSTSSTIIASAFTTIATSGQQSPVQPNGGYPLGVGLIALGIVCMGCGAYLLYSNAKRRNSIEEKGGNSY